MISEHLTHSERVHIQREYNHIMYKLHNLKHILLSNGSYSIYHLHIVIIMQLRQLLSKLFLGVLATLFFLKRKGLNKPQAEYKSSSD